MRSRPFQLMILLIVTLFTAPTLHGQKKLAQTGFQFLSVGLDARATAMAGAFTTVEGNAASLHYNPAGMAWASQAFYVNMSLNYWIADIQYNAVTLALSPAGGRYGVLGLSILTVDYGELQGTVHAANDQGYEDTEIFTPKAVTVGIGYSRYLSDRFSIGGQIKTVAQALGKSIIPVVEGGQRTDEYTVQSNAASAIAFDFGTLYKTGYKSFTFGMSVRNFSQEIRYEIEGFQLPLTFQIGASINAFDFLPSLPAGQSLLVSLDAVHPRSYPEYVKLGLEYTFLEILALRGGYASGFDEYGLSLGFGLKAFGLALDYAYTPFGFFDYVQRFTVRFAF